MSGRLEGKTTLITGAGSGIGRATAQRFAAEGARVVVTDARLGAAEAKAELIARAGGTAAVIELDVTQESHWARVTSEPLDVLVASAGISFWQGPHQLAQNVRIAGCPASAPEKEGRSGADPRALRRMRLGLSQ